MDVMAFYYEMPVVTRTYMTLAILTSTACYLDFLSPLTLYYNFDLVYYKGQYWRLFSSFIYFGNFSIDFVFHLYFITRYCRLLEEGHFRGRTPDFIWMLIIGAVCMLTFTVVIPVFSKIKFLAHSLSFMMVYVWGRDAENADMRMNLFGMFTFSAPYLPWVLLLFSIVIGNPVETDLLGVICGHIFYYMDTVFPEIAYARKWTYWKRILVTPGILNYLFGNRDNQVLIEEMRVPPEVEPEPAHLHAE